MKKDFLRFFGWSLLGLVILLSALFFPRKTVIDSNQTTITVKKQSLYQKWYCDNEYEILTYKQDVNYVGKIVSADKGSHFVGVPGKGGHYVTHFDVVVKYGNGKTIEQRFSRFEYEELISKPIIVREEFFPYCRVYIL